MTPRGALPLLLVLAALPVGGCSRATGPTLTVLAAASLTEPLTAIARDFERSHAGVRVRLSFGPSSGLAQQAAQGAPADVLATASETTMQVAVRSGAVDGAPRIFARNTLEIAVPPDNPGRVRGLADLARSSLTVAVCAEQVPCGAAAREAFARAGVRARPDSYETDVKAVLAKVELGEVDAGVVYRSDVQAAGARVHGLPLPAADQVTTRYPVAVLRAADHARLARAFVAAVLSAAGQRTLARAGFLAAP